jgi:hypothetical protein
MKKNQKQSKLLKNFTKNPIVIDENMPDFSNDPFVLAKLEKAEKFLAEHGLPESFYKKSNAKKPKKV